MDYLPRDILMHVESYNTGSHSVLRAINKRMHNIWPEVTRPGQLYWGVFVRRIVLPPKSADSFVFGAEYGHEHIGKCSHALVDLIFGDVFNELVPRINIPVAQAFVSVFGPRVGDCILDAPINVIRWYAESHSLNWDKQIYVRTVDHVRKGLTVGFKLNHKRFDLMYWGPEAIRFLVAEKILPDLAARTEITTTWPHIWAAIMGRWSSLTSYSMEQITDILQYGIKFVDEPIITWCVSSGTNVTQHLYGDITNIALIKDARMINMLDKAAVRFSFCQLFTKQNHEIIKWCWQHCREQLVAWFHRTISCRSPQYLKLMLQVGYQVDPNELEYIMCFVGKGIIDVLHANKYKWTKESTIVAARCNPTCFIALVNYGAPVFWPHLLENGKIECIIAALQKYPDEFWLHCDILSRRPNICAQLNEYFLANM